MKNRYLIPVLFSFSSFGGFSVNTLKAQTFTPEVISSSGTFASSSFGTMAWTIGEVMTETYSSSGNYFFTQGFHQPDTIMVLSVIDFANENISVYPNPVVNDLTIDLRDVVGDHTLYVYDMVGQILLQYNVIAGQQQKISFSEFSTGIYLINIVNINSSRRSSYKINKVK